MKLSLLQILYSVGYFFIQAHLYADVSLNSREICRRRIAGIYLKQWDEYNKAKKLYQGYSSKLEPLKKNLDKANLEYEKYKKMRDQDPFDMKIDDSYEHAFAKRYNSKKNYDAVVQLEAQFKGKVSEYKNKTDRLKKDLLPIFRFRDLTGEIKGYPFSIEYQRKCPRFKSGCPLKLSERKNMEKFFENNSISVPKYCKRYLAQGLAYEKVE